MRLLILALLFLPLLVNSSNEFNNKIEEFSKEYQVDEKLARRIIRCESANRSDAINRGKISTDYSYWQIADIFWKKEMMDLGWDITDPEDNLEAGFYILKTYGSWPWKASLHCHGVKLQNPKPQIITKKLTPRLWILPSGLVVFM